MKKKTNLKTVLILTSTGLGISALASVATLIGLHSNYKPDQKQNYFFEELKQLNTEVIDFLNSQNNQNDLFLKKLAQQSQYATQLLNNENSSVVKMIDVRNDLKRDYFAAQASMAKTIEDFKQKANQFASLVKIQDWQTQKDQILSDNKNQINNDLSNKETILEKLYQDIDNLLKNQKQLNFELEAKVWTLHEKILRNESTFSLPEQKSTALSMVLQVLNLLEEPIYSKDNLLTYQEQLTNVLDLLSKKQSEINYQIAAIADNFVRVRRAIESSQLSSDQKQFAFDRIQNYFNIAQQDTDTLAPSKQEELDYLNSLLNNEITLLADNNKTSDSLIFDIKTLLTQIQTKAKPKPILGFVNKQTSNIEKNLDQNYINDLINKKIDAQNLLSSIDTISKFYNLTIEEINNQKRLGHLTLEHANQLNEELRSLDDQNLSIINYLEKIQTIRNRAIDSGILVQVFKNGLNNLREQINDAINRGDQSILSNLRELLNNIDESLKTNQEPETLNKVFANQLNNLRKLNKKELANLYKKAKILLNNNTLDLSEKTRNTLEQINEKAAILIADNSTATRLELQYLIPLYLEEFKEANINDAFADVLVVAENSLNKIYQAFGSKESTSNSHAGSALQRSIESLQKEANIISLNPNLSFEDKEKLLKEISQKMEKISDNADKFKRLEEALQKAQEALDSTEDLDERVALENYINKIKQNQNDAQKALENPEMGDELETLIDSVNKNVDDFYKAKANYQAGFEYDRAIKKVNEVFGSDVVDGKPSPTKIKLTEDLETLKNIVSNPENSKEERDLAREKMRNIFDIVEISRELEVANKELKELIQNTKDANYGEFRPNDLFVQSQEVNKNATDFLANINNSLNITSKAEYQNELIKVKNQKADLNLGISIALLKSTEAQIKNFKITNKASEKPYKNINDSIDSSLESTQFLYDKANQVQSENPKDPQKYEQTQNEINELENKIRRYIPLASKLREAAEKLLTINESANPASYKNLEKAIIGDKSENISSNLIDASDNNSQINIKISTINTEIQKVSLRMENESEIATLKQLYSQTDREYLYFDEAIRNFDQQIASFEEVISNFNSSRSALGFLKDQIKNFYNRAKIEKQKIENDFNEAKARIQSYKDSFEASKQQNNQQGLSTKFRQLVFDKFDKLVTKTPGEKFTTLASDLLNLIPEISLASSKDDFLDTFNSVSEKIQNLPDFRYTSTQEGSSEENITEILQSKLNNLIEAIKVATVGNDQDLQGIVDPSQNSIVRSNISKLNSVVSLIDRQTYIINELIKIRNEKDQGEDAVSSQQYENIVNALKQYIPTNGNNATKNDIDQNTRNLYAEFLNNISLKRAKDLLANEINDYKKLIDNLVDSRDDIDKSIKSLIDAKLDQFAQKTQEVTEKTQLVPIEQDLNQVKFVQNEIIELAKAIKKAEDFYQEKNQEANKIDGQNKILEKIKNIYEATKPNYLNLTLTEISAKIREIEDLIDLYGFISNVLSSFNETKNLFEAINYPQGSKNQNDGSNNNLLTPEEAKSQFNQLFDNLKDKINSGERANLLLVKAMLPGLNSLIALQKAKIEIYNSIKSDYSYAEFSWNTKDQQQKSNYGFELDAIRVADFILESVPNAESTLSNIKEQIEPRLEENVRRAQLFYEQRKAQLDVLLKQDTGIKSAEYKRLVSEQNQNEIDPKYDILVQKGDIFYNDLANRIKVATSEQQIEEVITSAQNMDSLFERYQNIANLISEGKEKIQNISSKPDAIKNNKNTQKSIELLNSEISQDEEYYFKEQNTTTLDNAISRLRAFIGRFDLAEAVATKTNEINEITTQPNADKYLTEEAKAPLIAILDSIFETLERDPSRENINEYNQLKSIFVEGSSDNSVTTALNNSLALQQKVYLANSYLESFNQAKGDNSNYETPQMNALYEQLQTKVNEANAALANLQHNEKTKINLSKEIFDGFSGIIDSILNTKNSEISDRYLLDLALDKFMIIHYSQGQTTPRLEDYSQVALEPFKRLKVSDPESIKEANTKIKAAEDKYLEQASKLLQWEVNQYKSSKAKFEPYYNFFKDGNETISQSILLRAAGLDDSILTLFEKAMISPNQATETPAYNAKQNVEQMKDYSTFEEFKTKAQNIINDTQKNIRTILEEISTQSAVANRLFNTNIQNISVPKILVDKNQYQRFTQQFDQSSEEVNIVKVLEKIQQKASVEQKISDYKNSAQALATKEISQAPNESIDYTNSVQESQNAERQRYFTQYSDFIKALAQTSINIDSLVFGQNSTDQNNLKYILDKFLNGESDFVGRKNIDSFISLLSGPNGNGQFELAKKEYEKISKIANSANTSAQSLNENTSSVFDINSNLSRAFVTFERLWTWFDESSNTDLFFEYLRKTSNNTINYAKINPKNTTSGENFKKALDTTLNNEEDLTINGNTYKAKKLNGAFTDSQAFANLFEQFNVLFGDDSQTFNLDNINVYAYKQISDQTYVNLALTTDPSIKTGTINLYFEYKKPSSITLENNSFSAVESFGIQFPSVVINFRTRERYTISKSHIQDTNTINQTLFTTEDAGWNNFQAPINLMGSFVKYSTVVMKNNSLSYFTEDVTKNIDDVDQGTATTSKPEFRVKVKLSQALDGWTQVGDKIYWKTLTPNLAGSSGFAYQNVEGNDKYLYSTIGQAKLQEYRQHTYLYTEANDANKVVLILPLVIAIPVEKDNQQAVLILDWKMLSRFDENATEALNNITTWYDPKLTEAWLIKPTEGHYSSNIEELATHALSRISIRDFVFASWDELANTWSRDDTVTYEQFTHSIGSSEFYNAIGENGKFDIDFKLH
ncbi:rhoptry family protein [Mycoplasmopsis sturni]|uniref:hypothetical protein n=1 Tax=Mycoplasmopsis sturni TaxID=39047 RepID=UPI00146F9DD4|nr:hypothetical protein [Mycoplasmopsis sturni]